MTCAGCTFTRKCIHTVLLPSLPNGSAVSVVCCYRKCKMAVVGFEGSQEVVSTRDLCSCGANLLRVDLRKVNLANIQLDSMIHC